MIVVPPCGIVAAALLVAAGCHVQGSGDVDAGEHIPDFTACAMTDAGPYTAGIIETSSARLFTTTLVSVSTKPDKAPAVPFPTVGHAIFQVTFLDAGGAPPVGLKVTAEKPYMPIHGHGATTYPTVTDNGGGMFAVSEINFFMAGYWEITLDLKFPPMALDAGGSDAAADAGAGGSDAAVDAGGATDGAGDAPDDAAAVTDADSDAAVGNDAASGNDAGDDDGGVVHGPPLTTDKVVIPICIPN